MANASVQNDPSEPVSAAPRRLALVITELDPGGAERCLVRIARRIDRTLFRPVVYCLAPEPKDAMLVDELRSASVETQFLGAHGSRQFLSTIDALRRHFLEQRPELILSFLFHANMVARFARKALAGARLICAIRVAERRGRWRLWLDRWTSRRVDHYVCVSQSVADFSRTQGGLPADKLRVIPNGVDFDRFALAAPTDPASMGLGEGRRAILHVGRLDPQKGLFEFLSHAPRWLAESPTHDLVLAGVGPLEARLRDLCRDRGIADRVRFLGYRDDIPGLLKAADILVLPSRWEGMPNAILEAMAAGRAVVAFEVEGVRELLGENAEAQLTPPGDQRAFAAKLVSFLANGIERERLGQANQRRARDSFSMETMVTAYERVLLETLGNAVGPN